MKIIQYLSQEGPTAPKHNTWKHPLIVCILHYTIATSLVLFAHDYYIQFLRYYNLAPSFFQKQDDALVLVLVLVLQEYSQSSATTMNTRTSSKEQIANAVFRYFLFLVAYRVLSNQGNPTLQKGCIYEITWLCNMTLFIGSLGIWTGRDMLIMSHLITVSIDQVLWYVDLLGWAVR